MTDFTTLASSTEDSRPLEIYEVVLGSITYRWTSDESTVTYSSNEYDPEAISRNAPEIGADSSARQLRVTVPANNAFASQYILSVPGVRATFNCYRLQRDEVPTFGTAALVFSGSVLSVRFDQDGYNAELIVQGLEGDLENNIPDYTYLSQCNHVLYGARCGVNPAGFSVSGTVTAISGNVVTVSGMSTKTNGFFNGGYVTKTSSPADFRLILSHTGDNLTLLLPFADNVSGATLQAFAGCDHLIDGHCATRFDNVLNFGGFPFVPNRNPFEIEVGLD